MKPQPHLAKLNTQYMRDDIHTDTDNMLKWNTWWGFSNEPVISARWTLHVNCAGSTALIEGLLLPRHLVSPASLPSHTRHTVYLQSHSGAHIDTHARARAHTHTHLEINSHQYGRGQAIRWEVTLQMSRQLQGQRTYFFPAGAFLMGCRGRQRQEEEIRSQ